MLANSCINSFLRFGPNGMNSCYGLRMYHLERKDFNKIKNILLRTEIQCSDYKNLLNEDCFFFFDPPYASKKSSYTGFSFEQQYEFIELIKNKEYVYCDILNDVNKHLKNKSYIRNIRNTAPSSQKQKTDNLEYIFYSDNCSPILNNILH